MKKITLLLLLGLVAPACLAQSVSMMPEGFEFSSGQGEMEESGHFAVDAKGDLHLKPVKLIGVSDYMSRIILAKNQNELVTIGPARRQIPPNSGIGLSVESTSIFWKPIFVRQIYFLWDHDDMDPVIAPSLSQDVSLQKEMNSSGAAMELPDGREAVDLYKLVLWLVEENRKNKEEIEVLKAKK